MYDKRGQLEEQRRRMNLKKHKVTEPSLFKSQRTTRVSKGKMVNKEPPFLLKSLLTDPLMGANSKCGTRVRLDLEGGLDRFIGTNSLKKEHF